MKIKERTKGALQVILGASFFGLVPILVRFAQSINSLGYLFGIGAGFFASLNFLIPKKYFKGYDIFSLIFYQNLWMLPLLSIFIFLYPPSFTLKNLGIFASLGLFCTALAFFLVYSGLRKTHGQYMGILQTTEVLIPIILGVIIFSEIPSFITLLGGILLITGNSIIILKGND